MSAGLGAEGEGVCVCVCPGRQSLLGRGAGCLHSEGLGEWGA